MTADPPLCLMKRISVVFVAAKQLSNCWIALARAFSLWTERAIHESDEFGFEADVRPKVRVAR